MEAYNKINGTSNEAVVKSTGKGWQEWCELLDDLGGAELTHKQIADMLYDKGLIKNSWWCQQVTVGYEYARGRRVTGQTVDAGFEVGEQRTFPLTAEQAWQLLLTKPGLDVWLGEVSDDFRLEKGAKFLTKNGTVGEIRTIDDFKKLRLTWKPKNRQQPTTLQLTLLPPRDKTAIHFHHEKLKNVSDRAAMRKHWQAVLESLKKCI